MLPPKFTIQPDPLSHPISLNRWYLKYPFRPNHHFRRGVPFGRFFVGFLIKAVRIRFSPAHQQWLAHSNRFAFRKILIFGFF